MTTQYRAVCVACVDDSTHHGTRSVYNIATVNRTRCYDRASTIFDGDKCNRRAIYKGHDASRPGTGRSKGDLPTRTSFEQRQSSQRGLGDVLVETIDSTKHSQTQENLHSHSTPSSSLRTAGNGHNLHLRSGVLSFKATAENAASTDGWMRTVATTTKHPNTPATLFQSSSDEEVQPWLISIMMRPLTMNNTSIEV